MKLYFYGVAYYLLFRVRKNLRMHVGDIDAAAVPCGFGRAIGNKVVYLDNFQFSSLELRH